MVRRVEVDEGIPPCAPDGSCKIPAAQRDVIPAQIVPYRAENVSLTDGGVDIAAIGHIEPALVVHPVKTVKTGFVQIDKPGRFHSGGKSLKAGVAIHPPNLIVVFLAVVLPVFLQQGNDLFAALLQSLVSLN